MPEYIDGVITGELTSDEVPKVSLGEIEILDLISEGEIEGLVTGDYDYNNMGQVGEIGYSGVLTEKLIGIDGKRELSSIYWNGISVVSHNGQYNFQSVDYTYTKGTPNGSIVNQTVPELTVSRSINERFLGSTSLIDNSKFYKIFNKDCIAVIVQVKCPYLFKQNETNGEAERDDIDYKIYYRPVYLSSISQSKTPTSFVLSAIEKIRGKFNQPYIRSTRVDFLTAKNISKEKNFIGWEIKIERYTLDSFSVKKRNQTFIEGITEIYSEVLKYPNSAIVRTKFNAEYFNQIPERGYDVKLLKVKVPSVYNPTSKRYTEGENGWDGTFHTTKQWTNNPAWCFYDLLTNKRYGLGKYIKEDYIDKWTLYEIAKYCDTLVEDGYGGVEPRFACNVLINSREDAYKVINDISSIFNGITYYAMGSIFTTQDSPKDPIVQFTNANVEDGNFEYSSSSKRVRNTIALIRYNDPTNFYRSSAEYVEDIDGIRRYGIRELELTAFGCTSRGQAVRLGRWALLSETLETETVNFIAGLEAYYLRPGDIFKIFDQNKKSTRFAGRTWKTELFTNKTEITLDNKISVNTGEKYKFSLLTPSFNYEPSQVTNLTSNDYSNIRKSFIQNQIITGIQTTGLFDGKTLIQFDNNQRFDGSNYSLDGNLVWTLELASGTGSATDLNTIIDKKIDYYRTIKIEERENGTFNIFGLQYHEQKYKEIESGLGFERGRAVYNITPPSPTALSLQVSELTKNSKIIFFTVYSPNLVGVTNYKVYSKIDTYSNDNVPSDAHLMASMSVDQPQESFYPALTGRYYFRAYNFNNESNKFSTGYASGDVEIKKIDPIKDVTISSLKIKIDTGVYDLKGTKIKIVSNTSSDPIFTWQVGVNSDAIVPSNFKYRVSVRKPSITNIPDSVIYYSESGLDLNELDIKWQFPFTGNAAIAQASDGKRGPFREYDLIVEAHTESGRTSAGNILSTPVVEDGWAENSAGYDILWVHNSGVSGIDITSGTSSPIRYPSKNWMSIHGDVNITFTGLDAMTPDIVGGFVYARTGTFTNVEAQTGKLDIFKREFTFDSNSRHIFIPGVLPIGLRTGYAAISFYDKFDESHKKYTGISTGLYVSNRTPLTAEGSVDNLDILNKMNLINQLNKSKAVFAWEVNEANRVVPIMIDNDGNSYRLGGVFPAPP